MKVLSIDAWVSGMEEGQWEWNQWFNVGEYNGELDKQSVVTFLIDEGYLKSGCFNLVDILDDQLNIVVFDKENDRPLYAIEYNV